MVWWATIALVHNWNCISHGALALFPITLMRCSDKSNWGKTGFILAQNSRLRFIIGRKSRWQELEAAVHITSTATRAERNQLTHAFLCSAHSLGPLCREWYHPRWENLPISVHIIKTSSISRATGQPDIDNLSLILSPQVTLDCDKLTVKTNHHNSNAFHIHMYMYTYILLCFYANGSIMLRMLSSGHNMTTVLLNCQQLLLLERDGLRLGPLTFQCSWRALEVLSFLKNLPTGS